jgi:hypothetical protein
MQKSNQWQWGVIFVSIFVFVGILFALSAVVGTDESSNQNSSSQSEESPTEETPAEPEVPTEETPTEESPEISAEVKSGETVTLMTLVLSIRVEEEKESDSYDRDRFRHWVNVEEKCSAREFVLREESTSKVSYSDKEECVVSGGLWLSLYDNVELTDPSGVDIDHMVPLKEAWESGAHSWNEGKRRSYANDIGDERSLIAVSAGSNRSKSDRDPSDWMPTAKSYTCQYISDWVAVKYRWDLTMDKAEKSSIQKSAEKCEDTTVLVPKRG